MRCARARTLSRMVPLAYSSAFLAAVAPCERDATQCHPEPPLRRPERSEKGPHANEVDMASGLRTGDELARRSPEDQRDEGPSARKRSRYPAREALLKLGQSHPQIMTRTRSVSYWSWSSITMLMRRFLRRPSGVSLDATGWYSP